MEEDPEKKTRIVVIAAVLAASLLAVGSSSATRETSRAAPATVALRWNAYALAAVRGAMTTEQLPPGMAARSLYQTEGLLYMSYVQAAVYDAATKIGHRYLPYHRVTTPAPYGEGTSGSRDHEHGQDRSADPSGGRSCVCEKELRGPVCPGLSGVAAESG